MKAGVAFCLRQYHGLNGDLVRVAWVRFIRGTKQNQGVLKPRHHASFCWHIQEQPGRGATAKAQGRNQQHDEHNDHDKNGIRFIWFESVRRFVGLTSDNWNGGVQVEESAIAGLKLREPWPEMAIDQQTAEEAYASVLESAGATLPKRDAVDARVVEETRRGGATYEGASFKREKTVADDSRKSGIIDSQRDVGGWPELKSTPAPADTDHDGMPDEWETAKGLDPRDAADRNTTADNGYTMLEEYLNSID